MSYCLIVYRVVVMSVCGGGEVGVLSFSVVGVATVLPFGSSSAAGVAQYAYCMFAKGYCGI